jgi:hypothetical protein
MLCRHRASLVGLRHSAALAKPGRAAGALAPFQARAGLRFFEALGLLSARWLSAEWLSAGRLWGARRFGVFGRARGRRRRFNWPWFGACGAGFQGLQRLDIDFRILARRMAGRSSEAFSGIGRHFELRLIAQNADPPDFLARYMAAPAQEGQQPTRIGIAIAPNIHAEPNALAALGRIILCASFAPRFTAFRALFGNFLGRGQGRAQKLEQRGRQGFRRWRCIAQKLAGKGQIFLGWFFRQ